MYTGNVFQTHSLAFFVQVSVHTFPKLLSTLIQSVARGFWISGCASLDRCQGSTSSLRKPSCTWPGILHLIGFLGSWVGPLNQTSLLCGWFKFQNLFSPKHTSPAFPIFLLATISNYWWTDYEDAVYLPIRILCIFKEWWYYAIWCILYVTGR